MKQDFPKSYNYKDESSLYNFWMEKDYFSPDSVLARRAELGYEVKDESFMIPLPPPNVTGKLHVGHAMMVAVQDTMVRQARMSGYKTLWLPGTDHAAIATQSVVEKKLSAKGTSRFDLGRDKFLDEVRTWVGEHRGHITGQLRSLASSLDWSREQYTMSESLSRSVRQAFSTLYHNNKIYQDWYVVNWSPGAKSVVSNEEVNHEEQEGKLYYINYFINGKKHFITIATTRPETMFGDVAIAVNPQDRRYKKFIGKEVLIPLVNRPIPVIADEYVDMTFGTGALKITPAHDPNDFEVAKRHDLPMGHFSFDQDCIFTKEAGEEFAGKPIADFTENVINYIDDIGNLDRVETYMNSVPYCDRTKCRIQPMLMKQWFMKTDTAADKLLHWLDEDELTVHPQRFDKTVRHWLENIRPWCISRQIWW